MKLTYLAGAWTSERPVYFPNNGDLLDFYAYHPYEEGVDPTGIVFSVGEDQSSQSKFSRSDLMKTYSCENVKIRQPVNLSFYHTLALVHIEVLGASDPGLTATLLSCMPETRMNLADNLPLSGSGTTVEIAMLRLEEDPQTATSYTYRAIVPAQTIAAGTVFALFEGAGKKYEMKLQSEFRLRASVVEPVSVSIP